MVDLPSGHQRKTMRVHLTRKWGNARKRGDATDLAVQRNQEIVLSKSSERGMASEGNGSGQYALDLKRRMSRGRHSPEAPFPGLISFPAD
jgi:hypothetical protein